MTQSIQLVTTIKVGGVTHVSTTRSLSVEAYDAIQVTVAGTGDPGGADVDRQVDVQPGGAGQVSFVAITSDRYGAGLTYRVNAVANPPVALDQPQVLAGAGAVSLLDTAPTTLFFSSTLVENATVSILVGRDATP